ncbi:cilia- and flagella-associated protein 57 isoform X1 [Pangasianodon hypophthalmus]|uniref:cilia- and flagella-associated protein 57 isoform X1 n=1 Tax=Pangasianodon hypophthalmus TaxID=310915 RepID=UPI000EFE62A0|nr:cilia- and flagella-associated protein 57 isoform X1 [Pangasianodon hypophthalmus]XP_026798581.3 cilia- and flagella-associated protein 57 isoform X1 [Pangasianodon hypophthalmus]
MESTSSTAGCYRKCSHVKSRRNKKEALSSNEEKRELLSLQQMVHQLIKEKNTQKKKAHKTIHKQSQLIGSLEAERRGLQAELEGIRCVLGREELLSHSINHLRHHSKIVDENIIQEKQTIDGLQREIQEMHRKIGKERKASAFEADPTRKIQRLTGQLAQVNKKFSTFVSTNTQLRQDIETLRGEKIKFLQMRNKLEKVLQETHQEKTTVLKQARKNIEVREDAKTRMLHVLEQTCSEGNNHAVDVQELQRRVSHVEKTERFLQEKNKVRQPDLYYQVTTKKREAHEQEPKVDHEVKLNEYEVAMEKISDIIERRGKGSQSARQRRRRSSDCQTSRVVEPPQSAFWKSANRRRCTLGSVMFREAAAGILGDLEGSSRGRRFREHRRRSTLLQGLRADEQERLRELVQQSQQPPAGLNPQLLYDSYVEGENLNLALFQYALEQNRQIQEMTKDVHELRISVKQEEERESAEERRLQDRVRELKLSCQQVTQDTETLLTNIGMKEREFIQVRAGIESLAVQAGVDASAFELCRHWTEDGGTASILTLLAQIEQRVTQLLTLHSYTQYRDDEKYFKHAVFEFNPRKLSYTDIQPPALSFFPESEEEYDEELKLLSREELKKNVLETDRFCPA